MLSEIPDRWFQAVERWCELNQRHKRQIDDKDAPDRNEEYFFYQNLLGAWPLEELDEQAFAGFRDRIRAYMAKAIHEAKVHSSWQNPDPEYDEAIDRFVAGSSRPGREPGISRRFPGVSAFCQPSWPDQFAGPDTSQDRLAGRPRYLPGNRGLGFQPGRP